ncbi:MAG: DUF1553 domain-containing protein [Lentisphaerae bacterium]|nr:DUF1553 domain-containing protein [Lentisphaerota bacterium]
MCKYMMFIPLFLIAAFNLSASVYEYKLPLDKALPLNKILYKHWQQQKIAEPAIASDAVFLRRVCLTLGGRLPTWQESKEFLSDATPDKRSKLIDRLLESPEYADMQTMRFADMLRIKSEFPINLWPNAVQAYHRRIHDDLSKDCSLQVMFRTMLTASGSNFREPYANFFRASADRSPEGLAKMVLLTLMNMRESEYSAEELQNLAKLFSCIRYKSTYEWKEEIVYHAIEPVTLKAMLPDGSTVEINTQQQDPRQLFADWLFAEDNDYFERAFTNKVWYWVFGKGIYPNADALPRKKDFLSRIFGSSADQPFSRPVQDFLIAEFRKSNYSLKHLYRVILNSAAFQASSIGQEAAALKNFAVYPVRRLESELLIDALGAITGGYDSYMSVIPEPFTFLPRNTKAVNIADGSISTGVLDSFGRPPRDSGQFSERNQQSTDSQNLYLQNSTTLYRRINNYTNSLNRNVRSEEERLERIYLTLLSRYPTLQEKQLFRKYMQGFEPRKRYLAWQDTVWVIFNSKEFLFYH